MFLYQLAYQNGTVALVAFLLAFAVPYLIVYALHELRFRRLRLLKDYETSFTGGLSDKSAASDRDDKTENAQSRRNVDFGTNPSFEFVRSKYVSDIDDVEFMDMLLTDETEESTVPAAATATVAGKIDVLLFKRPRFFALKTNWRLMFTATAFGILTYLGFFFALICFHEGMVAACAGAYCNRVFFTGGMAGDQTVLRIFDEQLRTVMALTFIGGYVAAVREFLRRMSVFDLSSYNFLKQAAEIFASVVFVAFLYRAFPNPQVMITGPAGWLFDTATTLVTPPSNPPSAQPVEATVSELSWAWIALAPLFGLFPESASRYLFIRAGAFMNWIKSEDNRFNGVTRSVPIDVIDGIDFWTRIRLEQSGINDVQNLATFNPIMLYIETPYGFYQVFDWIAQAQLCHIIGIEKFLLFREINIRTIFDLERAIRSSEAPEQFDEIAVAILLATTSSMVMTSQISKLEPIISDENGKAKPASVGEFSVWARTKLGKDSALNTAAVEHIANWISDDLHVRRLRLLWKEISASLGEASWHLPDDKTLVAKPPKVDTPAAPDTDPSKPAPDLDIQ